MGKLLKVCWLQILTLRKAFHLQEREFSARVNARNNKIRYEMTMIKMKRMIRVYLKRKGRSYKERTRRTI